MVGIGFLGVLFTTLSSTLHGVLRPSPAAIADQVLSECPLIDLHLDLPVVFRFLHKNDVSHTNYMGPLEGHADLARLQKGKSAGFFSIAYTPCPDMDTSPMGRPDFLQPNDAVRNTLEQIDVTRQLVQQYPEHVALSQSAKDVRSNFQMRKISHFIGVEGAHSLGNSLAVLRTYYDLGVRYLTLTHTCHNAFADTAGSTGGQAAAPLHGGLSSLGKRLIKEMNRLGMIIDLSHTSDDSARQAIQISQAPVIFSHSGARTIHNHTRNIPDDVLEMIREGSGRDAVIGIPALPSFIGEKPTLSLVADHVEHIAHIAGRSRVAVGTDFDGFLETPIEGMENVTKYRNLLEELARRGWSTKHLCGFVGDNFLRVFRAIDARSSRQERADTVPWKERKDL